MSLTILKDAQCAALKPGLTLGIQISATVLCKVSKSHISEVLETKLKMKSWILLEPFMGKYEISYHLEHIND